MKFEYFSSWEQLPESVNTLFAQQQNESIYLSRPWFENLTTLAIEAHQTLLLACVAEQDNVLAFLPLVKNSRNNGYALKHRYSPIYSLLLADKNQQQVLDCLARGLSELPLHSLLLEPVADDDDKLIRLQQHMEAVGFECNYSFRFYNWIYRVHGQSFANYMADRPSWLRNTISRKSRKLEREHGYEISLYTGEDVPGKMTDYYMVYSASWKANEQYVSFLDGMVSRFSQHGWSRLGVLYIKGKAVAAQLWFVHNGKASIFRLSYDEAWKAYSPGSILTAHLMEYVIDTDKVDEIDFLTGNEAYKQDWMSERRERFAMSCIQNIKRKSRLQQLGVALRNFLKRS